MHDKEEDLLFSKSLFFTVTLLLGCNKDEEDRIGNRGFCFRPVANPDAQTTFVVAAAVCILESVWLQRDVKEKRNARVLFSCFKSELWCTCFNTKTEVLFFLICALKIVIFGREFSLSTFTFRVMIKNTREENVVAREERNFIFFTRFARRIKSRRRDRNGSDFLGPAFFAKKKKRDKKETEFFSKQKLHSFLFIFFSSLLVLFCGVSLAR